MSEETKQCIVVATGFTCVVALVMAAITLDTRLDNDAITEMVKAGADPMRARCAIDVQYTICNTLAGQPEGR